MKPITSLVCLLFSLSCFCQSKFESGYIINNDGSRQDIVIKNSDWFYNPNTIEYKKSMQSNDIQLLSVSDIKEFGLGNDVKFKRYNVKIDQSINNQFSKLSTEKEPEYKQETVFLKMLVEGNASLYVYKDGNGDRFFMQLDDVPVQLVFKKYKVNNTQVAENLEYKKQLYDHLKCETLSSTDIRNTDYGQNDLEDLFVRYNECVGSQVKTFTVKDTDQKFYFTVHAAALFTNLEIKNQEKRLGSDLISVEFPSQTGLKIGGTLEYRLPFNNDQWRLFAETAFTSFKNETVLEREDSSTSDDQIVKVDYNSIDVTLGIKYQIYLSNNSLLHLRGGFTSVFDLSDEIEYSEGPNLEINSRSNMIFGLGYTYKKRVNLEFFLNTKRNIIGDYTFREAALNSYGVQLGYRIF